MCLSPQLIKNPLYKRDFFGVGKYKKPIPDYMKLIKNYNDQYIYVPCGRCAECLQAKQNSFIQRAVMECHFSHMFFITLTYNNESLPQVADSHGVVYKYPESGDVQKMFKRIRQANSIGREFTYSAHSEYGGRKHRPHWHIMLFVEKYDKDTYMDIINLESKLWHLFFNEWKRNYGSDKKPIWKSLFTYAKRGKFSNYDCHYVNPISSLNGEMDVAYYVSKYLLKVSNYEVALMIRLRDELEYTEYREIRSKIRCKHLVSKHFGFSSFDAINYIQDCIKHSLINDLAYPEFINPLTGRHYPLARYYKEKCLTINDRIEFAKNGDTYDGYKTWSIDYNKNTQFKHDRFKRVKKKIEDRDSDFYELF